MVRQTWQDLLETYDTQKDTRCICPIAHTQIIANIGIMLDESSNILAAAKIRQSIFAPCTAKSECRSSNIAPRMDQVIRAVVMAREKVPDLSA